MRETYGQLCECRHMRHSHNGNGSCSKCDCDCFKYLKDWKKKKTFVGQVEMCYDSEFHPI